MLAGIPFRRAWNAVRRPGAWRWGRMALLTVAAFVILGLVYGLLYVVFHYFSHQAVIGSLLMSRIFSMAFMTFLLMLVYSNVLASLSSHFLSHDLPLLMALPVRPVWIFLAKAGEAVVGSSWMVVIMCIPLYGAFGRIRHAPLSFIPLAAIATIPFLLIPAALSMAATCGLMFILPARKMREAMLLFGMLAFTAAVVTFRLLEPEKLVDPNNEMAVFEYMKLLAAPSAPWLPSAWAANAVVAGVHYDQDPLRYLVNTGRLWGLAVVSWIVAIAIADRTYRRAWQQAQESLGVRRGVRLASRWLPRGGGAYTAVLLKDLKVFVREPSQWGQILLLASLVLIYVFNLSRIPPDLTRGLRSLLFFLNLGFIGLILTAVAARFLFPLVSLEGKSFELLRLAPVSMERYLWTRLAAGIAPLVVLGLALVGFSAPMLGTDRFMTVVASCTVVGMTVAIGALALGCGAGFAQFRISNPEEVITSIGGFVFMVLSVLYISAVLWLESQPVRVYYLAALFRRPFEARWLAAGAFTLAALVTAGAVVGAIRYGARSLERRELS
ncbi:MAG: hypothetical protein AAB152_16830 [Candidatus Coatesbacteria bacterium]